MVKKCCVKNCDVEANGKIKCFRFPNSRIQKRQWIDVIGLSNKLSGNSLICIKHFQEDDYNIVRGRPKLKPRVVPSVFGDADKIPNSSIVLEDNVSISSESNDNVITHTDRRSTESSDDEVIAKTNERITRAGRKNTKTPEKEKTNKRTRKESKESVSVRTKKSTVSENTPKKTRSNKSNKKSVSDETNISDKSNKKTHGDKDIDNDKTNKTTDNDKDDQVTDGDKTDKRTDKDKTNNDGNNEISEVETINDDSTGSCEVERDKNDKSRKRKSSNKDGRTDTKGAGSRSAPRSSPVPSSSMEELNKDIEDIIVHYQIKQTRPVHAIAEERPGNGETEQRKVDPVYIEVAVRGKGDRAGSPRDCVMVMESVQVELDPSAFLADGDPPDADAGRLDTVDLLDTADDRSTQDPISLLTSSDEDEVILQEPHIDTVDVSDETDEDDVPLVKLLKRSKRQAPVWKPYPVQFKCKECPFRTVDPMAYQFHRMDHSKIFQVCQMCNYMTTSKSQFVRHKRKHKEDKRYKCHLCEFKARHNMSLIYHLKTHKALNSTKERQCDKCGFKSLVKSVLLKHVRLCAGDVQRLSCDLCAYEARRPADLQRHKARRHRDEDDDEFVP